MQRGENENGVAWAAKLCAMIPEKWRLVDKPDLYPADEWAANEWAQECITDGNVVLHVRGFQWDRRGKMTVHISNPASGVPVPDRDGNFHNAYMAEIASKEWATEIRFAATKTAAQAWAEVDRRLLPDARRMMAAVRARVIALEAEDVQRAAGIERVISAAGGDWCLTTVSNYSQNKHQINVSGPERTASNELRGGRPYGTVHVYSTSVNLELCDLTHDQAAAIFVALRRHECERALGAVWDGIREAGADPREEFAAESAK